MLRGRAVFLKLINYVMKCIGMLKYIQMSDVRIFTDIMLYLQHLQVNLEIYLCVLSFVIHLGLKVISFFSFLVMSRL